MDDIVAFFAPAPMALKGHQVICRQVVALSVKNI